MFAKKSDLKSLNITKAMCCSLRSHSSADQVASVLAAAECWLGSRSYKANKRMDRSVPSEIVEQWMTHLRLQRTRARDMIWLIEKGATLHDGQNGEPLNDATQRWLAEQRTVVADVEKLLDLYDNLNATG